MFDQQGFSAGLIKKKLVEDEELDRQTRKLKEGIESTVEGDFNPSAYSKWFNRRQSVVQAAAQFADQEVEAAKELGNKVKENEDSEKFEKDERDKAIDPEFYWDLRQAYNKERMLRSHFGVMWYGDNIALRKTAETVKEQIMLEQSNKLTDKLNDFMSNSEDMAEKVGRGVRIGLENYQGIDESEIEDLKEEKNNQIHELKKRIELLEDKLEEMRKENEQKPLTKKQKELMDLVEEHPEEDAEFYADKLDTKRRLVLAQEQKIQDKGYDFAVE